MGVRKPSATKKEREAVVQLRHEDFTTSNVCRAGIWPVLGQPTRLSPVIKFPFLSLMELNAHLVATGLRKEREKVKFM